MHCGPVLAFQSIARVVEVEWKATGVDWCPFQFSRSKFDFISPVADATRKRADGTDVTNGDHEEICPVFRKEFADRGMSYKLVERASNLFLEKKIDYTVYPMLDDQDRVTGYRSSPAVSEGEQGNLTPGADRRFSDLPKSADNDDNGNLMEHSTVSLFRGLV